jgi:hypothetical protein
MNDKDCLISNQIWLEDSKDLDHFRIDRFENCERSENPIDIFDFRSKNLVRRVGAKPYGMTLLFVLCHNI